MSVPLGHEGSPVPSTLNSAGATPANAMIGALALSESAKNLEQLGRKGKVTENYVQLAEFKALYEAAKQAVQEELGREAA